MELFLFVCCFMLRIYIDIIYMFIVYSIFLGEMVRLLIKMCLVFIFFDSGNKIMVEVLFIRYDIFNNNVFYLF